MPSRRPRRSGRAQALLPQRSGQLSNSSVSCWYCDFKIYNLNKLLFSVGQRHARFLRVWFAFGVAFSFLAIVGVTMMLLWESVGAIHIYKGTSGLNDLLDWLFGTSPLAGGFSISIMDTCVMVFSTLMSVAIHEFGHAVAAARGLKIREGADTLRYISEGIQIEYIAIFLAILFPGALVAFNYDLLQSLPYFAALRIYCAGIWHNLTFSALCGLTLFLLPLILYPLYIHGEGPIVSEVPQTSPLSGYISRGDVIVSVDGSSIDYPHEWIEKMDRVATSGQKGYCIPNVWVAASENTQASDGPFSCPGELAAFVHMSCFNSSFLAVNNSHGTNQSRPENKHCLIAKDVVKLKKCGDGWQMDGTLGNDCVCSEEESCMAPVQTPGMSWVEISYLSPYSSDCLQLRKNSSSTDSVSPDHGSKPCGGTFVFVGDVLSLRYSIKLSAYRPRWSFIASSAFIPTIVEKILTCNFHVSATLGLLNSLPVYFLDCESILEVGLCYITWLNPRRRRKVLRFFLFGGTVLFIIAFSRIVYSTFAIRN